MLYDGDCGLCAASVRFILRHERRHTLRFAPLESATGRRIRARHPAVAQIDSMIWVDDPDGPGEQVALRSTAALRVTWYMGGPWRIALLAAIVPRRLRDVVYDFIARHRHRLADSDRCYVPPPSLRGRFVDHAW